MRKTKTTTHSLRTVRTGTPVLKQRPPRISKQHIQTLQFIHRFRHVTTKHVQAMLSHSSLHSSQKQLTLLARKGYLERHYNSADRSSNHYASYYLTPKGLDLLQGYKGGSGVRSRRSVKTDARLSAANKIRCHALADVYCYFKSHYNGRFEFFVAHDLADFDYFPDPSPDAYVRVTQADQTIRHYFVEIYGTGRSTYAQTKRLVSYVAYAESGEWGHSIGTLNPSLLILTASAASQARLRAQLQYLLQDCFADDFCIFTTSKGQLAADNNRDIWHEVHHRKV